MDLPAHQLTMTVLMTPDTANFSGNVHGGAVLRLLDQVAYACAATPPRSSAARCAAKWNGSSAPPDPKSGSETIFPDQRRV